jgi:intracellular sulfur oxidation DsrE/DsrF family protein
MSVKHIGFNLFAIACLYLLLLNTTYAEKPSDVDALQGLKEGKVVWDVTVGSPSKLLLLLKVIEETYEDLVRQNVKPDMIFTFHGPVMRLISTEPHDLPLDEEEAHEEIVQLLQKLNQRSGVKMESCSVAARLMGIDNKTILSGIKPVGNTFVSQIGYQKQGYAMIPIY